MLAAKFKTPVEDLLAGPDSSNLSMPVKQFAGEYTPVANLTTMSVDVSVGIQADLVLMFEYTRCNWSIDVGYNFWGSSCEKIEWGCDCCFPCFQENTWVLKGDAFMYGAYTPDSTAVVVPTSASQFNSTLFCGLNNYPSGDTSAGIEWYQNPGVDNRQIAWNAQSTPEQLAILKPIDGSIRPIYTSLEPVFIRFCDIDCNGARTRGLSHKLFAHFNYTWEEWCGCEDWTPYLGFGFEVEFAQRCCDDCCLPCYPCGPCGTTGGTTCGTSCYPCGTCYDNCCNDCCPKCAVSQWGVWLKGGFAFGV